jgi:phosphoenolpyruvate synthase/pyruvate phosphate dikinase
MASINEVYALGKKLEGFTQTAADAVKQLVENKNLANKFQKELQDLDKEKFKEHIEASKNIVKEIDSVVALYLGKEDKRQGITRNPEPSVEQRLSTASYYVSTRQSGITETEKRLVRFAEDELKLALDKTNAFFNEKWKPYRDSIETLDTSPFKETETFSLD